MVPCNITLAYELWTSKPKKWLCLFTTTDCNYINNRVSRKHRPRKPRPQTPDLENTDLENADLQNADLENTDLENTETTNVSKIL